MEESFDFVEVVELDLIDFAVVIGICFLDVFADIAVERL